MGLSCYSQRLYKYTINYGSLRPRTLYYILKNLGYTSSIAIASNSPRDSDCLIINVITGRQKIQLVNLYNEKDL
jgi:hypothetical protein